MTTEEMFIGTPVVPSLPDDSGVHTCENGSVAADTANREISLVRDTRSAPEHGNQRNESRRDNYSVDLDSSNVYNPPNTTDLRETYADYWARFDWTHFLVLTPATQFSRDRLSREFRRYINRIRRVTKDAPLAWLRVIERGRGGRCHLHVLIWTSFPLPVRHLEMLWDRGQAHVRRFNHELGGVAYVLKEFSTDEWPDAYDCSRELPPLRACLRQRGVSETSQFCAEGYAPPNIESRVPKREPLRSSVASTPKNESEGGQST